MPIWEDIISIGCSLLSKLTGYQRVSKFDSLIVFMLLKRAVMLSCKIRGL